MSLWKHFKIHYWPGLTCGIFVFAIVISYFLAVLGGHVYPFFPYVSDTATVAPESCLFGQLFNIGAVCLGITLYIRYRQVDIAIDNRYITVQKEWNNVGLRLSYVFVTGVTIDANFQETSTFLVHGIGAALAFLSGSIYFAVQTRISYGSVRDLQNLNQHNGITRKMLFVRTAIVICFVPLFFVMVICGGLAFYSFKGKQMNYWTEEDGGFQEHVVSTFAEWVYEFLILLYIFTFTNEFKSVKFTGIGFTSTTSDNQKSLTSDIV